MLSVMSQKTPVKSFGSNGHSSAMACSSLGMYLRLLFLTWGLLAVARIAFFVVFYSSFYDAELPDLLQAFYVGLRFDGRIAAIVTAPLGLMLSVPFLGRALIRRKRAVLGCYFFIFVVLCSVYGLDFGFYAYLGNRVNFTLFELLEDFAVSFDMVMQSYPVFAILLGLFTASLLATLLFWRVLCKPLEPRKYVAGKLLFWVCGVLVFSLSAYGRLDKSFMPLRWSNAYFSTNTAVSALALNPLQNLYDTYAASLDDSFDLSAVQGAYPLMEKFLGVDQPDITSLSYTRHVAAKGSGRKPNIVVIIMESMGYPRSSFAPGAADPTSALRELAAESVYFPNFFANTRTTARAVFTTLTGIPDVTESSTGSRNQMVVDQRLIADEFSAYAKYYMLGGSANWANIRGVLGNNIEGIKILDDAYWKSPRVDVWGVSDYDLLQEAHELFATHDKDKPFLAVVQTSSYHSPFTVPDTPGFEHAKLDDKTQQNYGYVSEEEYNSVRFADYAIGAFFKQAKKAAYYNDTIFILFGDHGIKSPSGNLTNTYRALDLAPWHVVMMVHAPGRLKPAVDESYCSQIDVFPTLASLAGIEYTNYTLGRDMFDKRFSNSRGVYIGGKQSDAIRMLMGGYGWYDNRSGYTALYKLDDPEGHNIIEQSPEKAKELEAMAYGIHNTAKYLLYNNRKLKP